MNLQLDEWQRQVLKTKGNIALCSPRQMGKSTIISEDAGEFAVKNPNSSIMIIASVERQALLLFEKVLSHIYMNHKKFIKKGKDRPTKHELRLTNGSIIRCLPTGDSGYGIRGYTIDRLYADEAAFIHEDVWAAVTPMLATTGGDIVLLSTPFGIENYFYRMFHNDKFTSIYVDPEKVIANRKEPQKTNLIQFRRDEKERMTKLQYQQEHLGLFVGGVQRFFPEELIDDVCTIQKPENSSYKPSGDKFQGIDIARLGGDETVLVSIDRNDRKNLIQFDMEIPEGQTLTDTSRLIIHKDKQINHKKIYIDDGGLGAGVYDILYDDLQTKRKVVGINNARRFIDKEKGAKKPRKRPMMKEFLYINLKNLMENKRIKLFDSPELRQSLRSIQFDNSEGVLKIYGNYSHITEAIIRAAYCIKDKGLKLWASSTNNARR